MDTRHTWHFPDGTKVCCDYCDEQISGPELKKATWYLHPECAEVLAQGLMAWVLAQKRKRNDQQTTAAPTDEEAWPPVATELDPATEETEEEENSQAKCNSNHHDERN